MNIINAIEYVRHKEAPHYHIDDHKFRLLHAGLGLSTELLELQCSYTKENTLEELGDFLWYLTLASDCMHIHDAVEPTKEYRETEWTLKVLCRHTEDLVSKIKKVCIYQKQANIKGAVLQVWETYFYHIEKCNLTFDEILKDNHDKLNKRYEDKFTSHESEQRKDKVV